MRASFKDKVYLRPRMWSLDECRSQLSDGAESISVLLIAGGPRVRTCECVCICGKARGQHQMSSFIAVHVTFLKQHLSLNLKLIWLA